MKPVVLKNLKLKEGRFNITWTDRKDADALDKKLLLRKKRVIAHYKRMVKFYQDEVRFWRNL